jgi:hypothetical protein
MIRLLALLCLSSCTLQMHTGEHYHCPDGVVSELKKLQELLEDARERGNSEQDLVDFSAISGALGSTRMGCC